MTTKVRAAIYTRKSTQEGLEQDFNSLAAQREACEAYVVSQKHEGWVAIPEYFNDGGFSGATMARPGLENLLNLVRAGMVDVVVVYKVDRLTRSLGDFAKMVEAFDEAGVSFVSVTQQFNTTTSMGRLTLNVLLSFAQFEREVTAERIRDKIAASKKKGMWMGGPSPMGYDVEERELIINEAEAVTVRRIFKLYLKLGSVRLLKDKIDAEGARSKIRKNKKGVVTGGKAFSRGNLYQMLSNPLYNGEVAHKGEKYPGRHKAIIDPAVWDAVQQKLKGNSSPRQSKTNTKSQRFLAGLIRDDTGDRLTPTYTKKGSRRHNYYVSSRLVKGKSDGIDGWRLPAHQIEGAVLRAINDLLLDLTRLIDALGEVELKIEDVKLIQDRARALTGANNKDDESLEENAVCAWIKGVELQSRSIIIKLDRTALLADLGMVSGRDNKPDNGTVVIDVPCTLKRRGVEARLVIKSPNMDQTTLDGSLIILVAQARRWFEELTSGKLKSVREIAKKYSVDEGDVSRFMPLAFLAPDIVETIVSGKQPIDLTAERLKRIGQLPHCWEQQRSLLGF